MPFTGIVAYRRVCQKLAELILGRGGEPCLLNEAMRMHLNVSFQVVETRDGVYSRPDFALRDFAEVMLFVGFWRLAGRNRKE